MDIKFSCDKCGQHIAIHEDCVGQAVTCPHCGQSLTVPTHSTVPPPAAVGPDIFFDCYKCRQNIVINAAGIGELVPCPKCGIYLVVPNKSN